MLVLSRKIGERMMIGETIVLTILEVNGRRVRLGIEAPPDVAVWRDELCPPQEGQPIHSTPLRTVPH